MKQLVSAIMVSLVCSCILLAQASTNEQVFEVASVKVSKAPGSGPVSYGCRGGPGTRDATMFTCDNLSLVALISQAYDVDEDRIIVPTWARSTMYDIAARVPTGTTVAMFKVMQQHLLVERFHLIARRGTKIVKAYELSVDKGGSKLEPLKRSDAEDRPTAPPLRPNPRAVDQNGFPLADASGYVNIAGHAKYYRSSMTVEQLALLLGSHLGVPVKDATGLSSRYELRLLWLADQQSQKGGDWSDSLPELQRAMQQQLGLRLDPTSASVDVLEIGQADRTPVAN